MSKSGVGRRTLKRSSVVAFALLLIFLFLVLRVFAIQVFDFARYQQKVIDQLTTESPVRAARGEILDATGRVLATNRTVYRISLFPNVVAKHHDPKIVDLLATGLAAALPDVSADKVREHLSHTKELTRTVARAVELDVARAVLDFVEREGVFDMVAVEAINTRYYPYGDLASHLLGFTGSDGQGLYGIELQYDSALAGKNGSYVTARDSFGNEMPNAYEAYIPATDGCTLVTTIDAYVQAVLEEQLRATMIESGAANRVAGIVMDVNTGGILAMATAPSFDLNTPFVLNAASEAELAALGLVEGTDAYNAAKSRLLMETWSNKALTEIYMPGSTFKTLTCSMVLEEGAVTNLSEMFFCAGCMTVADRNIHCHKVKGHGSLTFVEGLQNSCNPVMMTIAARLGTEKFYEYVRNFGLLEKSRIDLPGEGNSIFHAASNFTPLDLATASFGQNFKVSILQMITAVSAVANGGKLMTPYVVDRVIDADGNTVFAHQDEVRRTVISEKTAATISEILAGGVAGEGGAKNAYVAGYRVAAKTGTSEKIGDNREARIGSCVAYAPADAPEVAVIIVVDEPTDGSRYGSVVAAPYVANVLDAVLPYLGVEAVYTEAELEALDVLIPDFTGMTPAEVEALLADSGISCSFAGEGDVVTAQSPAAGSRVLLKDATVRLSLGNATEEMCTVPDIIGRTAAEANRLLVDSGFNVKIEGAKDYAKTDKLVLAQSVAAGTEMPRGTVIAIRFAYDEIAD